MDRKLFLLCLISGVVLAQDLQTRIVVRPAVHVTKNWYVTTWIIGNARLHATNNLNIFPGIGYKGKNWWVEVMAQRQWSPAGNSWMLDFRWQRQLNSKNSLYLEFSPFITKRAYYHFVIYERKIWKKLNVGVETENIQRTGLDSIGAGPRISYPLVTFGKVKLTTTLAYRFHRREQDILRLYVVFSRK